MQIKPVNRLKLSESLIQEILQYLFAFFFSWLISSLLMDFPFFSDPIKNSCITAYYSQILVWLTDFQLHLLGFDTFVFSNHLGILGTQGVIFAFGCLGFRYLLFFMVFVLLQFGRYYHKIWYLPAGILLITWVNSVRAIIIVIGQYHQPTQTTLIHDVVTPVFMYPTILFLWIVWVSRFGNPTTKDSSLYLVFKKLFKTSSFPAK